MLKLSLPRVIELRELVKNGLIVLRIPVVVDCRLLASVAVET